MPIYVVRHGCAGDKRSWPGPDSDRPLDEVGLRQADALADDLGTDPIGRILTSPAMRCRQTVAPLAARLALPAETDERLSPDGDGSDLARSLAAVASDSGVICTHGELMRPMLAELRRAGVAIIAKQDDDDWLLAKGTTWQLTLDTSGTVVALEHRVAPVWTACPSHDDARR